MPAVSSKKKRGKQRKAAKTIRAAVDVLGELAAGPDRLGPFGIKLLERGHNKATLLLAKPDTYDSFPSGALSIVLNFLKRCENESFSQVMTSVRINVRSVDGADGGDLESPSTWIKVLDKAAVHEPSCRLQIAENIGPLVKCMCNDVKCTFFRSNKHWVEVIVDFTNLLMSMLKPAVESNSEEDVIVNTLLQQDGLLRSIIQWGFWNKDHCQELIDDETRIMIMNNMNMGTAILVNHIRQRKNDRGTLLEADMSWLVTLATTPIVSKESDPTCTVSFVEGSIQRLKIQWTEIERRKITQLMTYVDCVDKGVIKEVIDLGLNFTTEYGSASSVAFMSYPMILQCSNSMKYQMSDTRTAFAIRAGLIEMYLSFVDRFGEHVQLFSDVKNSLFRTLEHILKAVYEVSLHQKSAMAIRHQRSSIEEKLRLLDKNVEISSNPKCKELLDMVRSIIDTNGSYCCRCNKQLSKTEVMECNGCHSMAYCSRSCQKEDWSTGHKLACCKSCTDANPGQLCPWFQGRICPETVPEDERAATKLKELEKNINMIQLKLFLDNAEDILNHVKALAIPLRDCIVKFDLRNCPPTAVVERVLDTNYFGSDEERKGFESSRFRDSILCFYISRVFNGERGEDDTPSSLVMQRLFAHEWLTNKKKLNED